LGAAKVEGDKARDRRAAESLVGMGWRVITLRQRAGQVSSALSGS
jgi:hypothetical protein